MPELGEVARVAHFMRQALVGRSIKRFVATPDDIVFKNGDVTDVFQNQKVVSVDRHGKYFWISFATKKCVLMHLGMTGWIQIQDIQTAQNSWLVKHPPANPPIWPPKFWKFHLETDENPPTRLAFTDPRRLGRAFALDISTKGPRQQNPLATWGLDPIVDASQITTGYLREIFAKRTGSIKGGLLKQENICGIGNWMADEILYHAGIHPQSRCCDVVTSGLPVDGEPLTDDIIGMSPLGRLHANIHYVCQTSFDLLADDDKFPEHWLFKHRWGRGKKQAETLPTGEQLEFITVDGRTSCFVPSKQALVPTPDVKVLIKKVSTKTKAKRITNPHDQPRAASADIKPKPDLDRTPVRQTRSRTRSARVIQDIKKEETSHFFE